MYTRYMSFLSRIQKMLPPILKTKWAIGAAAVIVIGGGYWVLSHSGKTQYQFITVMRAPIVETVSVTGNTTPVQSVSLGFGSGGIISGVYASVGQHVGQGALLASLNASDLAAQLKQAQANVDSEKARLAGLEAGARPEDIASSQASYDKSVQDLTNYYSSASDVSADSYAKATDAVNTQLSVLFSNGNSAQP